MWSMLPAAYLEGVDVSYTSRHAVAPTSSSRCRTGSRPPRPPRPRRRRPSATRLVAG